jgi:hypothetical protein
VTHCEPGRDFGFTVYLGGKRLNNWRYRLVPADGGTDVTESFELEHRGMARVYWAPAGWHRSRANGWGMRQTLERARTIVEAGTGSAGTLDR